MNLQVITIQKVQILFPELELWLFKQPEDTLLYFYNGSYECDELNLDWREDEKTVGIIINGNLTVTGNIWNSETDGGISLIVIGNLSAKNIVVGGQEIYIEGNLWVQNLLYGSYNHGDMRVKGDIQAKVIVADDYQFSCNGVFTGKKVGQSFFDESNGIWLDADIENFEDVFIDEVLGVEELYFEEVINLLQRDINPLVVNFEFPIISARAPILQAILSSKLITQNSNWYGFEKSSYLFEVVTNPAENDKCLIINTENDKFAYKLASETISIFIWDKDTEKFNEINLSEYPLVRRVCRFLKEAGKAFIEKTTINRKQKEGYELFLDYLGDVLSPKDKEFIRKKIKLAIDDPYNYILKYKQDCEARSIQKEDELLSFYALIDALKEKKVAIEIHEQQTVGNALEKLLGLPIFEEFSLNISSHQLKLGRKLFNFYRDVLVINDFLPYRVMVLRVFGGGTLFYFICDNSQGTGKKLQEALDAVFDSMTLQYPTLF
ncbi:polymer-forming cytoskeletal protein [Runella aurantiaca]|nr:polymer-forming cytoskeletal protein [Runella aurantiaca]